MMPPRRINGPQRAGLWLGHYAVETALLWPAAATATLTLRMVWHGDWSDLTQTLLLTAAIATSVVATLLELAVHDRVLCPRDLPGRVLLDPEGAVRRRQRHLQLFHWIRERRWVRLLLPAAATTMLGFVVIGPLRLWPVLWGCALLGFLGEWTLQRILRIHTRLRPWCGWCRQDGLAGDLHAVTGRPGQEGTP